MANLRTVPRYDLSIKKATDWQLNLIVKNDDGTPKDLTGYTAAMKIRRAYETPEVVSLTSSPAAGITITAALGKISIAMTNAQTAAVKIAQGVYDVLLTNTVPAPDTVTCILEGEAEFRPVATR